MPSNEMLVEHALQYENLSASEVAKRTGISQPTVSRVLKKMQVIKLGAGRSSLFARVNSLQDLSLYQVSGLGQFQCVGNLYRQLENRSVLVNANETNKYVAYDGLPFYLYDALPAGFLGSILLNEIIKNDAFLTAKSQDWNDEQVLYYLKHYGADLVGNLVLGSQMANRAAELAFNKVSRQDYSVMTRSIHNLPQNFGSSVAGEQPKFTTYNGDSHLIVKYSPPISESNAVATRHRDLMVCEHLALKALNAANITAAESELYVDDRFYLEVKRFDREGDFGRKGMVSLKSIDAEYVGKGGNWVGIVKQLLLLGLISENDVEQVEIAYAFGRYIANTDMHNGNCSFFMEDLKLTGVTPVYDMLPMAFMPVQGELRSPDFFVKRFVDVSAQSNQTAMKIALFFWESVINADLISKEFRVRAQKIYQELKDLSGF